MNADNWEVAVNSLEKQFKNAMELTYCKKGREKVEQCRKQAFCIKVSSILFWMSGFQTVGAGFTADGTQFFYC